MAGNDSNTVALWHFDGADGATTGAGFADDSVGGSTHNLTAAGDAQIDTAQSKFGGSSIYFDGNGDYCNAGTSADYNFGTADWGIDFWFWWQSFSGAVQDNGDVIGTGYNSNGYLVQIGASGQLRFFNNKTELLGSPSMGVSAQTWAHVLMCMDSGTLRAFVNGAQVASAAYSTAIDAATAMYVGADTEDTQQVNGRLDEIRVVKGICPIRNPNDPLYISSGVAADGFTPPTSAYSIPQAALTLSRTYRGHVDGMIDLSRDTVRDRFQAELHLSREWERDTALAELHLSRLARGHVDAELDLSRLNRGHVDGQIDLSRTGRGHVESRLDLFRRDKAHVTARIDMSKSVFAHVIQRLNLSRKSFVRAGWALYATDTSTGTTTYLGFIKDDDSPLALSGVSLADGTWDIEARPWGNFWQDCRSAKRLRLVISGGEIASSALPAVQELRTGPLTAGKRDIQWSWLDDFGVDTPADFALWFSASTPVVTTGTPTAVVNARAASIPHLYRYTQSAAAHVAVAARDSDSNLGPVSELELTYPSGTLTDPAYVWAEGGA